VDPKPPGNLSTRALCQRLLVVEVTVAGKAAAAGSSASAAFKDFLATPNGNNAHLLQLEIERVASWRFRIDGVL
jgi:hypothetical protein